jgi:hypothetical protein
MVSNGIRSKAICKVKESTKEEYAGHTSFGAEEREFATTRKEIR